MAKTENINAHCSRESAQEMLLTLQTELLKSLHDFIRISGSKIDTFSVYELKDAKEADKEVWVFNMRVSV